MRTCLVCQQDKVEQQQPRGLLKLLPITKHPWESVTMDFIIRLPKLEGYNSIIVVVDRFSKYATFIAAPIDCTWRRQQGYSLSTWSNIGGCLSTSSAIVTYASLGSFGWSYSSLWDQSFTSL